MSGRRTRIRIPRLAAALAFAGQLLCVAAVGVFLLGLSAGGQQRAAAATRAAWLGLSVTAPQTVKVGEAFTVHLTVTNQTGRPCALAPSSQGTVGLSVARDGARQYPGLALVEPVDDIRTTVAAVAKQTAPGGSVSFGLSATPEPGAAGLSELALAPDGTTVSGRWLLDRPGRYTLSLTYAMPGGPGECPGGSGTATVTITVAKHCAKGLLAPLLPALPWMVGGGALLTLAAASTSVARVPRRRVVAVRATAVAVCVALLGLGAPTIASADIVNMDAADTDMTYDLNGCLAKFASDDPLQIMPDILHRIHIRLYREYDAVSRAVWSHDEDVLEVHWNPSAPLVYHDGVPEDRCATLYHELIHIDDMSTATNDNTLCTDALPVKREEIRAVRGENLYRQKQPGLLPRSTHGDVKLPPGTDPDHAAIAKQCDDLKPPPPPVRSTGGCSMPLFERPHAQPQLRPRAVRRRAAEPGPDYDHASCSTGDPHLTTFDGRHYDFQTVGEFVLAKDDAEGIEVQERQAPLEDSRLASVDSAFGLRIGPDRLTFAMDDGVRVELNGADIVPSTDRLRLSGGGSLRVADDGQFEVGWPDGTVARIGTMSSWGLSLLLIPSTALRGKTRGLLGNDDGDPDNDLVTGTGQVLTDPPDPKLLFGAFADTWRVTDATSLLPYPPGRDTATFTDRTFPDKPVTLADLDPARAAAARELCRELGVTDSSMLEACVLDVGLGGQPAFATSAEDVDRHVEAGQGPPGGVVAPGGTLHDGDSAAASITKAGQSDVYHLDLGSATVFRLADLTGGNGDSGRFTLTFKLDPDESNDAPGFTYTSNYQWRVDPRVSYTLTVKRDDGDTGKYGFLLLTAKEKRIPMTVGRPVAGNLEARGRVDIHTFTAPSTGKLLLTAASGCDLTAGLVEDSPAPNVLVPYGVCSDIDMETVQAGQKYDLIVWSDDQKTGQYSFTPVING
ncbi:hypothetical protein ABH935_008714 [Catenulispora sp. GAS73]|uniref:VWD domain-containing protein n=1 Tax=Catenulispora sp. GAS73 TaxID=3156269 RepID=UPI003517974C